MTLSRTEQLHLRIENRFPMALPGDPDRGRNTRAVNGAAYSFIEPEQCSNPTVLLKTPQVAHLIGITDAELSSAAFAQVFSGNAVVPGMDPYAMCYGGHQFGHWADQLGDGRAIILGEVRGADEQIYALQLKGAGKTPYSRRGDGRAVLRSSLREFLCSEAMHALGIPTTRALSLIATGDAVVRDMLYDGHPTPEPGAIVCRVAPTFLRFGNYELPAARGDLALLKKLVDMTIVEYFPHLGPPDKTTYLRWFREVCERTAIMVVGWQRVGFVHGVMNTDNMSILGLTIDYGPYGWLDNYDEEWTPNTTDAQRRRYRYGQQPRVALWNLAQLANAIYPLVDDLAGLEAALDHYDTIFASHWRRAWHDKLGLQQLDESSDEQLFSDLLALLGQTEIDMTIFYRNLAKLDVWNRDVSTHELLTPFLDAWYKPDEMTATEWGSWYAWLERYAARSLAEVQSPEARQQRMNHVNPKYVFRNYLAQVAIDGLMQESVMEAERLFEILQHPYDEQPEAEHYAGKRPDWARERVGCSMLSCSS